MDKLNEIVEFALALHAAASIVVAATPTPKDDNILGKVYKVIEFFALAIGKAKQRWLINRLVPPNTTVLFFNYFS